MIGRQRGPTPVAVALPLSLSLGGTTVAPEAVRTRHLCGSGPVCRGTSGTMLANLGPTSHRFSLAANKREESPASALAGAAEPIGAAIRFLETLHHVERHLQHRHHHQ